MSLNTTVYFVLVGPRKGKNFTAAGRHKFTDGVLKFTGNAAEIDSYGRFLATFGAEMRLKPPAEPKEMKHEVADETPDAPVEPKANVPAAAEAPTDDRSATSNPKGRPGKR